MAPVEQSPAHDVFLAVQRLAQQQGAQVSELLKAHGGLSAAQFNVLRILRGAESGEGGEGLTCGEIGERLLAYVPDVTRLLDRLEKQNLIRRSRERADRRVVTSRLTPLGADLLSDLDVRVNNLHHAQFEHLSADQLAALLRLIQTAAQHPQSPPTQGEPR
ncbi:MarR family winged helix-turn-helix transcriptional regulator [Deinococcus psychrotolerans]|uniref:MarR family winged helix-turn-helix transcriptional regulator n=1 Tax=Deinococcus psychrotolerans TaxID=2489213 RepID=UPI0013DDF801|nr:MarR family transcriptional regulator [Deinococcus psychrotolerans]